MIRKFFLGSMFLCVSLFSLNLQASEDEINIKHLKEESLKNYTLFEEKKFAKKLRLLVVELGKKQSDLILEPLLIAENYRKKILKDYPYITKTQLEKAHGSVGSALFSMGSISSDEVIEVLLREAYLLSASAQIMLKIIYDYKIENYPPHDPRILAFFKEIAEEGSPRGLYEYGRILLGGIGVPQDKKKAIELLEKSTLPEAQMELATYYYTEENAEKMYLYLKKAAEQEYPQGVYNLGVLEQNRKNYKEAIQLFEKTIELDPHYWGAHLELARMYIEGWGVDKNPEKAIKMLTNIIENSEDETLKEMAKINISVAKKMLIPSPSHP